MSDLTHPNSPDRKTSSEPGFSSHRLTTKQTDNDNCCFSIAVLLGEAFISLEVNVNHVLDMEKVATVINDDALVLGKMLIQGRNLREGQYIDLKHGLQDCKSLGIITGQYEPRYFPSIHEIPIDDYYYRSMIAVSGEIDNQAHVEALIQCAHVIPTCCYCVLGVSMHYVVLTKSDRGEYALYEGIENILNDDTNCGAFLISSDARSAVQMVMHYGDRRREHEQEFFKDFDACIIKPSSEGQSRFVRAITLWDWKVFYDKVFSVATRSSSKRVINRIAGNVVTLDDFRRLKQGEELNDSVINYFFGLLEQRDAEMEERSHFCSTFWMAELGLDEKYSYKNIKKWTKRVPGNDVFSLKRIIIPVHGNRHWTCLCVDFDTFEINYYDSMDHNKTHHKKCMESVKRFLLDEWWETRGTESDIQWKIGYKQSKMVPQQHNGVDCGVFVCMYAEYLSRGVNVFDFKQEDMNALRLQIALSIMGNDYFNRFFGDISTLN